MKVTSELADHFNMNYGSEPYWNESSWFSWGIPEKNINGLFYYFFRPNMGCLNGGPGMWDGSGLYTWDCLYWDWQYMRELPAGKYGVDYNKYNYEAPCSMSVKMLEPLKKYHLKYDRNGFKLDLIFEGVAEPNTIGDHSEGRLNTAYRFHFEQPGKMKGKVALHGEEYKVDCFAIRDGSHGRRSWGDVPPGGYTWSTADERTGWHLIAVDNNRSRETKIIGGYLLRDGKISSLAKGVRWVRERFGAMPSFIEIEAQDAMGRELHAVGRIKVPAEFHYYSDQVQWWCQFAWEYDGFKDAIGEDQEYYKTEDMRAWKRGGPELWRTR
jgi:hypothetical protein